MACAAILPFAASADILGALPDDTHAWAVHDPNRPRPPVVRVGTGGVPSDALVLWDGAESTYRANWRSSKNAGDPATWKVDGADLVSCGGSIETVRAFGDCQLHVEWCAPDDENPQHGNSGVYLMGLYEIQIINSHEKAPGKYHEIIRSADEQAGSIYGQKPPLVNPIRRPGEWNVYDIVFHRPLRDAKGRLLRPATVTVLFNGVLVQDGRAIEGPTQYCDRATDGPNPAKGPLRLQDHDGNVRFRNVWIRELSVPEEEDRISGTSVADRSAVAAQRERTARALLAELEGLTNGHERLVRALEMLTYSTAEPFLKAATRIADAEAAALPELDIPTRAKRVSELTWYFDRMQKGGCLPTGWRLVDALARPDVSGDPEPEVVTERIELFNGKDLTNWYTWIRGYGRDNDPEGVFTVTDGVIRVHGPGGRNGGLTTVKSYRDYRLIVEFRFTGELFGAKLKQDAAPDSGILFHSTGPDGAFYGVWMSSWEFNLIVGANGDFWSVIDSRPGRFPRPDMRMTVRGSYRTVGPDRAFVYDPDGQETLVLEGGCLQACNSHVVPTYRNRNGDPVQDCENPVGEWNTAELICDGDRVLCRLNGVLVNEASDVYPNWGRIQIQNESCGCEFRRITLYPLDK